MPNRNLTSNENFESIQEWLNENLSKDFIRASCENTDKIPHSKGIYFWYLNKDGYDSLSKYISISPVGNMHTIIEDQNEFHLVYVGTSGTGKNGNYDINKRLKWHICEKHKENSICRGFISTLRKGIGSLISDDLILPNTEKEINEIFNKYFKIKWIEYSESNYINADENILINILKPLMNIKNNPNSLAIAIVNPTKNYKSRRDIVTNNTIKRLNCLGESKYERKILNSPSSKSISYEHQIISNNDNCIEFTVLNNQSIAEVIRGIQGLPIGQCCVICYNSKNFNDVVYEKANGNGWRKTGTGSQNIYTYFSNVDTNRGNQCRWLIIQNEMNQNGISEITVKVCWQCDDNLPDERIQKEEYMQLKSNFSNNQIDTAISNDSSAILITCAGSKQKPDLNKSNINDLSFPELSKFRNKMIELSKIQLNWNHTLPAWKLYSGPYSKLYPQMSFQNWDKKCCEIKILSALFGWIKPWDLIPYYDLKMDDSIKFENDTFKVHQIWFHMKCLKNYVKNNDIDLLSGNYRKAIIGSTLPIGIVPKEFTDRGVQKGIWLNDYLNQIVCN
jgi:hypothetical protein